LASFPINPIPDRPLCSGFNASVLSFAISLGSIALGLPV
jgi:hypothetical protein